MKIGELAHGAGVSTKTIRYYEDIGVLPEPGRSANGYREYQPYDVDRLTFIRDAQATGLTLSEIASILELRGRGESTCHHVMDLLERHLAAIERTIEAMQMTRQKLADLMVRAGELDPADCTDPNRCQTISLSTERTAPHPEPHGHGSPQRHDHG